MFNSLEVQVLYPTWWRWRVSEAQGQNNTRREAGPERSVEQRREPMNKNRIWGLQWRASEQLIAKPRSIKFTGGKSGGCASKAVELTSGDLRHVTESWLRMKRFTLIVS